jgi:hypothetical protein
MRGSWCRIALAFATVVGMGFPTGQQAAADWQYTQWGMSKAQVVEASQGLAVDHLVDRRETWGIYPDLVAPSRFGKYRFRAYFYFDDDSGGLKAVRLDPLVGFWCQDVAKSLMLRYGSDQRLTNDYYVWRDDSANNKISLSGFSTCRVKYEPLNN